MHSRAPKQVLVHRADGSGVDQESGPGGDLSAAPSPAGHSTICNVVMKITVDVTERQYFEEEWHLDIYESMSAWKGFLYRSTNVINVANGKIEYVTILGFDNLANLRAWITSDARRRHMDDAKAHGIVFYYINEYGGSSNDDPISDENFKEKEIDHYTLISQNDMAKAVFVPRPPPKWKLFFIIWFGVYLGVLLGDFSGLGGLMAANGFPLYMIILISLGHSVTCLSYTFFPLLMSTALVSKWLKAPRPPPSQLSDIMWFLDLGLDMFSEDVSSDPSVIADKIQKLEGKVEKLKKINHDLFDEIGSLRSLCMQQNDNSISDPLAALEEGRCSPCGAAPQTQTQGAPESDLSPPLRDPVGQSVRKLKEAASGAVGIGGVRSPLRTKPAPFLHKLKETGASLSKRFTRRDLANQVYISPGDAEDITIKNSAKEGAPGGANSGTVALSKVQQNQPLTLSVLNRVKWECTIAYEKWLQDMAKEMSRHAGFFGMTTIQVPKEENAYINTFSFDNYDHLTSFILSKQRMALLKRLEGMLIGNSVSEVTEEQSFHAVFDELFVSTGGTASLTHPPVWKTTLLVITPLFFLVWCVATGLSPVLLFEVGLPPELVNLIGTCITVFVNSYFGVPVMHMFFGKWHRRHRKLINRKSWFSFLDMGLSKRWQIIVMLCYIAILLCLGFGLFQ